MHQTIIGRKEELGILQELYESEEPQFFAVYGRRRIGKTFLVSEFFKDKGIYFEITGMKEGALSEQLFQFAYEFSRQFNEGQRIDPPKNWAQALHLLHEAIEKVEKGRKIILFFDEVPWLASRRSKFLNAMEHFWNRYISRNKNIIMIICGSSASWIIRNIINNRGGLHGRVTKKMRLLPFTLSETEEYLKSRHIELERKQIIDIYMVMGGVPKYLSYITRGKSATQIINEVCFSLNGGLYNEFYNLYKSLFDNYEHHIAIVKTLAKSIDGLAKNELLDKVRLRSGGTSSRIIEELVDAGFLAYVPSFNKKKSGGIYRLIDEYSLFYLTWMAENSKIGLESIDPEYWIKKQRMPTWNAWSGCAFESLCLKHIRKIKQALGISGISTIESGWRYLPKKTLYPNYLKNRHSDRARAPGLIDHKRPNIRNMGSFMIDQSRELSRGLSADSSGSLGINQGAQIDLVIDRADKCINLCEMKYSDSEFVVDKSYVEKLLNKKKVFKERTGVSKTIFMTMVTTYGVRKNSHYSSAIDNQLTVECLF